MLSRGIRSDICSTTRQVVNSSALDVKRDDSRSHGRWLLLRHPMGVCRIGTPYRVHRVHTAPQSPHCSKEFTQYYKVHKVHKVHTITPQSPQRHSAWQRRDRVATDMSLFGWSNVEMMAGEQVEESRMPL